MLLKYYEDLHNMHYFKVSPKLLTSKKSISSSMDEQEKTKFLVRHLRKFVLI